MSQQQPEVSQSERDLRDSSLWVSQINRGWELERPSYVAMLRRQNELVSKVSQLVEDGKGSISGTDGAGATALAGAGTSAGEPAVAISAGRRRIGHDARRLTGAGRLLRAASPHM